MNRTSIEGLFTFPRPIFHDERGTIYIDYLQSNFAPIDEFNLNIVQCHTTVSKKDVLRGIHVSHPSSHFFKLVTCSQGEILEKIVDLRPWSPSYLQTFEAHISSDSDFGLLLSPGLGHSYLTLSPHSTVHYSMTSEFKVANELSIHPFDETLNLGWEAETMILSMRDTSAGTLSEYLAQIEPHGL